MDHLSQISSILTDSKHTRWIAPTLILVESVLCGLIIWKIPYTEIDYTTYLQQAHEFLHGERHYTRIKGASGPLVYPALHLYIYSILYKLTAVIGRDQFNVVSGRIGVNIGVAQIIFACLYILTLAVVLKCYRNVNVPPWLLAPLVLSKRLHSIFLLRLFNDAWATFAFWVAVLMFQKRRYTTGALIWCLGVGVKMSVLLTAPAVGFILVQAIGLADALYVGALCALLQIVIAQPFLGPETGWEYMTKAFEFSRVFLFKWTVNWRFVGKETFQSTEFAVSLLVLHVSLLIVFAHWKLVWPSSRTLADFVTKYTTGRLTQQEEKMVAQKVCPTYVMDSMLGSMVIGLLCARSLHYQFFAYLGWASPYILWRASGNPVWVAVNWAVQEACWLVFPSTTVSSAVVVFELTLQMVCSLISWPEGEVEEVKEVKETTADQKGS